MIQIRPWSFWCLLHLSATDFVGLTLGFQNMLSDRGPSGLERGWGERGRETVRMCKPQHAPTSGRACRCSGGLTVTGKEALESAWTGEYISVVGFCFRNHWREGEKLIPGFSDRLLWSYGSVQFLWPEKEKWGTRESICGSDLRSGLLHIDDILGLVFHEFFGWNFRIRDWLRWIWLWGVSFSTTDNRLDHFNFEPALLCLGVTGFLLYLAS